METVINAVNKLKGEWPTGYVMTVGPTYREVHYGEFIKCLNSMATNYGTSETYADYKINYALINDDMKPVASKVDWPETEYSFALSNKGAGLIEFFYSKPTSNCEKFWMVSISDELYLKSAWELIEKPKPEVKPVAVPTFNQAMSDAGELPLVGMECLVLNQAMHMAEFEKCTILFRGDFKVIYSSESCHERVGDIGDVLFKPLTPPITLEDGKAYQFTCESGDVVVGIYSTVHISFDNYGSRFRESKVTNIKLLGVTK